MQDDVVVKSEAKKGENVDRHEIETQVVIIIIQ